MYHKHSKTVAGQINLESNSTFFSHDKTHDIGTLPRDNAKEFKSGPSHMKHTIDYLEKKYGNID